ncbi:MAG TPA: hypothetical protein VMP13_07065 [Acidimicrobiia bacterium]|nr:hypothetical protein [Acidimicrobiia bacterium]
MTLARDDRAFPPGPIMMMGRPGPNPSNPCRYAANRPATIDPLRVNNAAAI